MFRQIISFTFICVLLSINSSDAQIPIGSWREHLNYQNTIQVVKGNELYCATKTNLFSIDNKGEITRYSKINGLNDIGINAIGWDETTKQLIIAYKNSNLDILKGSIVRNISDILQSKVAGNKTINHIYCKNGIAYLSTGLGIILVDLNRYEIKDSWIIGNNGSLSNINATIADNNFFYAASIEGLKRAVVNSSNLANYTNWFNMSGSNGLPLGTINFVGTISNQLVATKRDTVFIFNNNNWKTFYSDSSWQIINTSISSEKLHISQKNNAGNARVVILSSSGVILNTLSKPGVISLPQSAISDNNSVWIADQFGGLSKFTNDIERFIPNGPAGIASGEFAFSKTALFSAAGSVNTAWNYLYNRDGIFKFGDGSWTSKGALNTTQLDTTLDFITLAVDPIKQSLWAGSYGGGLVQITESQTTIYKQNNSLLQAAIGDPKSFRVSGLSFDANNNLWISNYGAPQPLKLLKSDGTWKSFSIPFSLVENAVAQIINDDYNQLWIISPKNNGLICYQYGNNVDNTNDDQWKLFKQGIGNGNLPSNNILSITKDKNNSIWVGTDDGIAVFNCNNNIFGSGGCDAILPIIQQDQFAGFLFKGEQVQCIAVDGANKKWVGTLNGVWLISSDGKKLIQHFTTANSPLLSNDIKKIGIDPQSGEVFFATFNGICSYRSTATDANESFNNILVFPNPVPAGYNGTIAIKGLTDNSIVKITELNGRLVYQTRSLGGQAIWNGKDYNGNKIATGVYLVIARNDSGEEKIVTKIIITSGR